MDLSFAPQFSNIADEILARIEENSEDEWWDGILSLSVQLEEIRRRLGFPEWKYKDAEWPAFLVFEAHESLHGYGLHGIPAEFSDMVRRDFFSSGKYSSVCVVLFRDPLAADFRRDTPWLVDSEHNQHRQPGARKECIKTLRRWIRAVSQLSTKVQPTPGELKALETSISPLDDASDDWISGKSVAHILGIKTTKTLTNRRHQGVKGKRGGEAFGLHDIGCFWRKRGNGHPRYYLPRMKELAGQLGEIFAGIRSDLLK